MRMYAMCAACGRAITALGRLCPMCRQSEIQRRRLRVSPSRDRRR